MSIILYAVTHSLFCSFIPAADENDDLCMAQGLFVAILILLVGGLVASSAAAVVMYKKLQEKMSILNKLNGSQMGHVSMPVA